MNRKSLLQRYWESAATTEGWYPPYADALREVDAKLANWRPSGAAANTIWEIVTHVTYFKERLLRRLDGLPDLPLRGGNDETFRVAGESEADWQQAVERLFRTHKALHAALNGLDDTQLDEPLPEQSIANQFLDLIVHDAYHTGQIVFICKLYGKWPERRSFL